MKARMAILAMALFSAAAFAQGPGMGKGMGMGSGCCSAKDTPGWSMMNPEERKAHQEKMAAFKDKGACMSYMEEHHKQMVGRAKEKGMKMPEGMGQGCDRFAAKEAKS